MKSKIKIVSWLCSLFLVLIHCVSCSNQLQTRDASQGDTEILNYSYTNEYFKESVRRDHFQIAVTVDSPAVIDFGETDFHPVHVRAGAECSAIVKITVTPAGKVSTLQFVNRAGAGFDEYIEEIIRKSTFKPVEYKGKKQNSGFIVHVVIREI